MLNGDQRRRRQKPAGAPYGEHAGRRALLAVVEVPRDAHRRVSERPWIDATRLDGRGYRDQEKNEKQPPPHSVPEFETHTRVQSDQKARLQ